MYMYVCFGLLVCLVTFIPIALLFNDMITTCESERVNGEFG